jgi:ABC-type amino acid transport system permease subunit
VSQTYDFDFSWVGENLPRLLDGALLSLKLAIVTALASFVVGLIAGQMRMSPVAPLRWIATAYADRILFLFFTHLFRISY